MVTLNRLKERFKILGRQVFAGSTIIVIDFPRNSASILLAKFLYKISGVNVSIQTFPSSAPAKPATCAPRLKPIKCTFSWGTSKFRINLANCRPTSRVLAAALTTWYQRPLAAKIPPPTFPPRFALKSVSDCLGFAESSTDRNEISLGKKERKEKILSGAWDEILQLEETQRLDDSSEHTPRGIVGRQSIQSDVMDISILPGLAKALQKRRVRSKRFISRAYKDSFCSPSTCNYENLDWCDRCLTTRLDIASEDLGYFRQYD
ncbi:hypothetical protein V1477_002512 [Vespula maculifrons]|uniref:Uncharacterized protein n=1 Tax=Vespula maculifrons TaxID=7453 RepID=A0ABD2CWV8_VESMC